MLGDSGWVFAAGLTPGLGAGLGAGYPSPFGQWCRGMVIPCAASTHLQMPVVSGGGGGGSSWKKMCEWILLLQNDWAEVQMVWDGLGEGDDEQVRGCVIVLYLLCAWLC